MKYTLLIEGHTITLCADGNASTIAEFSSYTNKYELGGERHSPSDVIIKAEFVPGWGNENRSNANEIEMEDGQIVRVEMNRILASGTLTRAGHGFAGKFKLNGDGPDPIDGVVSFCLSLLCEESGELLLHSSAVTQDDHAYLFLGHGGAGKTTIAVELNGGRTPLSVDRTLVAFDEDGTAIAHSTPFGDRNHDLSGPGKAPIAGIFFIEQADEHRILPVDPFEATRLILAQTIAPTRSRATVQKVMDAVGKLVDLGCCYKLRFKKDDGFWPLIDEALAGRK